MPDVSISYNGEEVTTISESGSKTIQTAGKFCEDDILLEYQKANPDTVVNIPTVTVGTYTYNGSAQGPTISNYDSTKIVAINATKTNVGTYTLTLSLANAQTMVWSDNTTADKTYEYTINKLSITPPTISGNYTYNGNQQSPSISYASGTSGYIVASGDTSATNAGTYTVLFNLNDINNTEWTDGTVVEKSNNWSINKATPTFNLSSSSVTLNDSNTSNTVTLTYNGDGTISVSSFNTSVVTVSYNNGTITITSVNNTKGTATITVSATSGTNYNAPSSKSISVTASFATIYGASWDGTSTTIWTRTDAAAGFTNPAPYVPGGKYNGSSPFDNLMPWSGMIVSERTAGVMVAIPKFYYKITQNGSGMKIQIADGYVDGFSVSPAHMRRGSETADRDVVYIGRYHCATDDYKSTSGVKPKANVTCPAARSGIHSLGNTIWQCDFAMRFTIWLLYLVEFANWNSQAKIGYGCGNGYNSSTENMGYTDSMPYHTGTTQSNRTTYGLGTQYRNIEGLWDNVYDWMDGCYCNSNGLNIIMNPSSFSDSSNGTLIGTPSNGYPSAFSVKNVSGTFPTFIPSANNGSNSTYSCDAWYFNSSNPCLYVGGSYSQSLSSGLIQMGSLDSSYSSSSNGCRLMELP